MPIWFNKSLDISRVKNFGASTKTMSDFLEIAFEEIGDDFLKMSMPVNERTKQVYGLLHGGASCVLAETVGSIASALVIDLEKYYCVGLEINANHLRGASHGKVTATASPLHLGKKTHVWDIKIHDDGNRMICVSRLTVAIIPGNTEEFVKQLQY